MATITTSRINPWWLLASGIPDIHAEEASDDVNRQREDRDHRQGVEGAVALLQLAGANLLLQQTDALDQAGQVIEHHAKLFGELTKRLHHCTIHPRRRPVKQPEHRRRLRRQQPLKT